MKDLEKAFKSYRDERHAAALAAEAHAKNMCKFYGQVRCFSYDGIASRDVWKYLKRKRKTLDAQRAKKPLTFSIGTDRVASFMRFIFKNMPFWLWALMMRKHIGCRLQASFLPPVPDIGTVSPDDIPSYCETLKVVKAREAAEAEKAAQNKDGQAGAGTNTVPL